MEIVSVTTGVATHHPLFMMVCAKQAGLQGAQMSWMIRSTTPSTRYTVIAVSFNLGTRQSMQRGRIYSQQGPCVLLL